MEPLHPLSQQTLLWHIIIFKGWPKAQTFKDFGNKILCHLNWFCTYWKESEKTTYHLGRRGNVIGGYMP